MRSIIRRSAAVVTLTFAALMVACGSESPTAPSAPTFPRHTVGGTIGSGGRTSETPINTAAAADSGSTATNRGGGTFGSGA
jgi:hypothetical protein